MDLGGDVDKLGALLRTPQATPVNNREKGAIHPQHPPRVSSCRQPIRTSISSVGVSRAVNLDWGAAPRVSFSVTGSSSGTFSYVVEGVIDDLQQVASANVAWTVLSSATTANSSLNLYQGPLAAIRLNVAAISSATLSLRVLQEMP